MNIDQLISVAELGAVYAFVALGVFISFRVIRFPDLTVDGSFPLGAAIAATSIIYGISPIIATILAIAGGVVSGIVTGVLYRKSGMIDILAGIVTMTALYSINLRIMGRPNIALIDEPTIFTMTPLWVLIVLLSITASVLWWFLKSDLGLAVRGAGMNPTASRANGIHVGMMTLIGLSMSNGLVALGGALFAQLQGFADVSMGTGTIIIGLASVMIGEILIVRTCSIFQPIMTAIIGSILYRLVIGVALQSHMWGLQASDLNLITSVIVVMTMLLPQLKKKWFGRKAHD